MRFFAGLLLLCMLPRPAEACAWLTPEGQRAEQKRQERYLAKESDRSVIGDFRADPGGRLEEGDLRGVIEVKLGKQIERYRVTILGEINCGFPYYFLKNGDRGTFYLKRENYPDPDDHKDGYIDNYSYVHFRPISRPQE